MTSRNINTSKTEQQLQKLFKSTDVYYLSTYNFSKNINKKFGYLITSTLVHYTTNKLFKLLLSPSISAVNSPCQYMIQIKAVDLK